MSAHFPANVFQEVMRIADASKNNAHDQNDQIIITQACWELQTVRAVNGSTLNCTEILKSMQISRNQNLAPIIQKHVQQSMLCSKYQQQP